MTARNEIILQCKICKDKTLFNHPVIWERSFKSLLGEYELTDEFARLNFEGTRQSKNLFRLGYYTCSNCKNNKVNK